MDATAVSAPEYPLVREEIALKTSGAEYVRRPHLDFLDGIRGLAALYVTLHHAYMNVAWLTDGKSLPRWLNSATRWLAYGGYAVAVFIVLSGYCLMIPVARTPDGKLAGGIGGYLCRRVRRIIPPYYAALAISMILISLIPALSQRPSFFANAATPVTWPSFAAHLLLIHNLQPHWFMKIDPPMWSICIEFQIYFLFPLLFLPVWRRLGLIASSAAGVVIAYLLHHMDSAIYDYSHPFYVALFGFGMAAAAMRFAPGRAHKPMLAWPWLCLIPICVALQVAILNTQNAWIHKHLGWLADLFLGGAVTSLLIATASTNENWLRRWTELPLFANLGKWSYSLYLIHCPLLAIVYLMVSRMTISPAQQLAAMMLIGVPASLAAAYGFFLVFERPFLSSSIRS